MRRIDLDHLLENAVAKAIGVKLPHASVKLNRTARKVAHAHRQTRHAA